MRMGCMPVLLLAIIGGLLFCPMVACSVWIFLAIIIVAIAACVASCMFLFARWVLERFLPAGHVSNILAAIVTALILFRVFT